MAVLVAMFRRHLRLTSNYSFAHSTVRERSAKVEARSLAPPPGMEAASWKTLSCCEP